MDQKITTLEQFWAAAERMDPEGWAKSQAAHAELLALRKDAERYRWLRDLLAVEDVARLVNEHAQWSWCETDPAESAKTDAAVDKAMAASKAVGAA